MSVVKPKVYMDTMIFIYYVQSTGILGIKSKAFLQDIENGKFIGVVATNTITEYLAITKRIIFKRRHKQLTPSEIETIMTQLEKLIQELGIEVFDADELVVDTFGKSTVFSEVENLVRTMPCSIGQRDGEVHSLCGADALSVIFASRIGANLYATFDDDFRNVVDGIKPLMIGDVY